MKLENKAVWEGEDDRMSSIQKKGCEYIDPSKQSYIGIKESFNGKKSDDRCMEAPCTIPADEIKLGENETEFCTDKTVTEIQPPEMIDCYKDGACHNIKDICVDEGVCSLEKILVENDESSQRFPSSFNYTMESGNVVLSKEMTDGNTTTVHDSKSTSCEHLISVEKNALEEHFSGSLSKVGAKFDTTNPFVSDISDENISLNQFFPLFEFETDSQKVEPTNFDCSNDHKHYSQSFSKVGNKFHATNPFLSDISDEKISFKQFLSLQEVETDSLRVEPTNIDCSKKQLADHQKFNQGTLEVEYSTTSVVPSDARQSTQSNGSKENASICLSQGTLEDGCLTATSSSSDVGESEQSDGIKESPAKCSSKDTLEEGCLVGTSASYDVCESVESSGIKEKPAKSLSQGPLKDVCSQDMAMPSDAKESNQSSGTMGNPANAELESGVSGLASVGGQEGKEKIDRQQDGQAKNDPVTEEAVSDNATTSARSSFVHNHHLDADFSEPVYMSGPISSSGHIPYSGSISLRSDSSTTSTRSFAFPVLQSEWNSSPVKMAKADRRHLRKHRGWRVGLLCCKF
ncbi:uncharacterized protein LOC103721303 [Phoenix dactylifera]|uniref:Uncharacterized protein LOC103721303 n=1 Tax=Phoenix dactylifera TaxID=42345 RepID=A0A8B7CZ46_PHODC|nr:uncharacterized protein LOC103721303 [Phoenix dactylifera]XP_008809679.1 uncharacterized protein LOC103721303 [Phoenix dactylifera]XP_038984210.1 uncharacterized protein LOC103721303 [Phoenix dactylifera]